MEELKLRTKVIVPNSQKETGKDGIKLDDNINYDDKVLIQKTTYEKLFGLKSKKQKNYTKGHYIKISYGNRSLHRRIDITTKEGITKNDIVMSYLTAGELAYSDNGKLKRPIGKDVTLSKGCWFTFWLKHPNPVTRISFKLGVFSLILGICSIILTLI